MLTWCMSQGKVEEGEGDGEETEDEEDGSSHSKSGKEEGGGAAAATVLKPCPVRFIDTCVYDVCMCAYVKSLPPPLYTNMGPFNTPCAARTHIDRRWCAAGWRRATTGTSTCLTHTRCFASLGLHVVPDAYVVPYFD